MEVSFSMNFNIYAQSLPQDQPPNDQFVSAVKLFYRNQTSQASEQKSLSDSFD